MSESAGAVAGLSGASIIGEIKASGIQFVVSVPDITTSDGLLRPLAKAADPRLVRVCKEDEGVAICAGLSYTGKRGLLLIQQTGLLDSINAIRGVAVEYNLPICMMVGLLEKEVGVMPRQSKRYGVRIVEPILDAMGIAYHNIEQDADVPKIRPAIDKAFAEFQADRSPDRTEAVMMDRQKTLAAIARHVTDADIVLPVYSTAFDWIDIRPNPLNYLSHGAMGLASSHALGLALGRPDRRVIVLDGDGSLLMNLGTLVTTAEAAPKNLFHFVCENGTYEANGGHPIPGRGAVSFAGMARSAGYKSVYEFSDLKIFEQQAGAILAEQGPVFVCLKIVSSGDQERDYSRIHGPHVRKAFKDALGAG